MSATRKTIAKALIVWVTASSRKEAERIARAVVDEKLAACASIVPDVYSRYRWKGRIENAKELLLILKTTPARYTALEKRVRALHSYKVPEILAVPVYAGNPAYLRWLKKSV